MAFEFGHRIYLLRSLFPSWKFFEDFGPVPQLWLRTQKDQEWSEWRPCLKTPHRKWGLLFHNPELNYQLACGSLLTHFATDLNDFKDSDLSKFKNCITYQLTKNLVDYEIRNQKIAAPNSLFQFKLTATNENPLVDHIDDVFISDTHEVSDV